MRNLSLSLSVFLLCLISSDAVQAQPTILKVDPSGRFLIYGDGSPFFYLGDTAWELFHRLNREEAELYLRDRARKSFTVIQAVVLGELDGIRDPNAYGHVPFHDDDPTRPREVEGPNNDYWDHVDWIVERANSLGLFVGMLPSWGDKWSRGRGPQIFTPSNAEVYGRWLGERYRHHNIIWVLGGDREIETEEHRQIITRMAKGLGEGDRGTHLMTFHPRGGHGSAEYFHDEDWLDFNMRQNGHEVTFERYSNTRADYDREPVKPVMDGEPVYEDHPISFDPEELGHTLSADVRRPLYWNLFTGAFGHTYGHHSIWQMYQPGRDPINGPLMPWYEAIHRPGSGQMQYVRRLMESRPFLTRIPDDSIIVAHEVPTAVPGAGRYRYVATRDRDGTYAMVYAPGGRAFQVRMDVIRDSEVRAWWFNPRTGSALEIGTFKNHGVRRFHPPDPGESLDWVLVLDDASRDYPPPGSRE